MADLFILLRYSCFAYVELATALLLWSISKPVKQEVSRTMIPYGGLSYFSIALSYQNNSLPSIYLFSLDENMFEKAEKNPLFLEAFISALNIR